MHYPVNRQLPAEPVARYDAASIVRHPGDEELLIIVSFSGGGSRAAALAFGVIEELHRQQITWHGTRRSLASEVDMVFGVSGGSMAAAFWALRGPAMLDEFPERFLARDLQTQLLDDATSSGNVWRLSSPRWGRGELLAQGLDRTLFQGATFADLATNRQGPFAVISATDLTNGARFDFLQETFDLICSDLGAFPLSRAVAASSAVPVVFAPVTLWNQGRDCPHPAAPLIVRPVERGFATTREQQRLGDMAQYQDVGRRPYIHLVDGGVADNLALRGVLDFEDMTKVRGLPEFGRNVKMVWLVSVDAGTDSSRRLEQSADIPEVADVLEAMTDIPIQRFSDETRTMFREALEHRRQASRNAGGADVPLFVTEVSLRRVPDPDARAKLLSVPTSLYLPREDVQALRDIGASQLRDSPDYRRLMKRLEGTARDIARGPAPQ